MTALSIAAQPVNPWPPNAEALEGLVKNGIALSQQGDYQHAIPLLKRAISLAPQDATANFQLGVAQLQSGHPSEAVTPLQIAARENPNNEAAEGYLGDAEMQLSNFALAAKAFRAAVVHSPDSEQALMWWTSFALERYRALSFALRNSARGRAVLLQLAAEDSKIDATAREGFLKQAAALDPELNGVWGELGVAQARLGLEPSAEANLEAARQKEPNALSTLELETMVDAGQGKWDRAESIFLEIGSRSPSEFMQFRAAWPRMLVPGSDVKGPAWQCMRSDAADCASVLSQLDPQSTLPAERAFKEGRWELLTRMPAPAPDNSTEWFWRGFAYGKLGNCAQAIQALELGLKAGAENAAGRLMTCYESEAVHTADHLKSLGKESAVHQIRGDILLSIRLDAKQAAAEYMAALQLKPKDPQLLEKLAEAYFSLGEMSQARENAQEALAENPHREQLLRLLIRIAVSERDYASALTLSTHLAEMEPEDAWTRVQQATAYAQTGRTEEAVQQLTSALNAGYPDEKGALHALLAGQLRKLGRDEDARRASSEAIRLADSFQQQATNKAAEKP
jgi:tetratricopeptide (TPR) repeat protein